MRFVKLFVDSRGMTITAEALAMLLVFLSIAVTVSGYLSTEFLQADTILQNSLNNIHGGGF